MNFAIVALLAVAVVGCGGKNASAPAGTDAGGTDDGVLLSQSMGWVDGTSNSLGIQGAVFDVRDPTSESNLALNVTQPGKACIRGTAAKVDTLCTPPQGVPDCFSLVFGVYLGENLNQMPGGSAMPFDASGLKGFSFDVEGPAVPVQGSFRFNVEDGTGTLYGSPIATSIVKGSNTMLFANLVESPSHASGPSADTAKAALVRITWQVVTNDSSTVPFDFCVANVRALPE